MSSPSRVTVRTTSRDSLRTRRAGRARGGEGARTRAAAGGLIAALGLALSPGAARAQETAPKAVPDVDGEPGAARAQETEPARLKLSGTARSESAVRLGDPALTKLRQYLYLKGSYALTDPGTSALRADAHVTVRGYYDAVHALTDQYPSRVRRDEQDQLALREAVVSLSRGPWSLQLGKQQTVWGEAVALFFADVVNAKDLREFILRDFTDIRIPVWAVDARYHAGHDRVVEVYWAPDARFSRLPLPGAEFALFRDEARPGVPVIVRPSSSPGLTFGNSSVGVRYSQLWKGWDLAGFWYSALYDLPGVSKRPALVGGMPAVFVSLLHPRTERYGATFSKPKGAGVFKGEFVYTSGRRLEARGVAPALERDELTVMGGANYPVSRYNADVQLFHTRFLGDRAPLRDGRSRTGLSVRFADDASLRRLKPSLLVVWSLNQKDSWVRPRVQYRINDDTTMIAGFDWFGGGRSTLFGQFRDKSRFEVLLTRHLF